MSCSVYHLHLMLSYVDMYERNKMMMMMIIHWQSLAVDSYIRIARSVSSLLIDCVDTGQAERHATTHGQIQYPT